MPTLLLWCAEPTSEFACSGGESFLKLGPHIASVHEDKLYKCSSCDKGYTLETTLMEHIAEKHSGEKQHECSICGSKFSSKVTKG